jgi:predicted nucleotide-binding protein
MARRSTSSPPQPQQANLTLDQMKRGIARIQTRIKELEDFNPQSVQKRWAPEVVVLQKSIDEALIAAFGHGTIEYNRYVSATKLDTGPVMMSFGPGQSSYQSAAEAQRYVTEGKHKALLTLRSAIKWLEEEISDRAPQEDPTQLPQISHALASSKVFVVHGHDEGPREAVARFLERLGLQPVILHECPNKGRTIITKFQEEAAEVGFAIVLMTPDDVGGVSEAGLKARARQNVVFELGFFIGALGPARVAALVKGDIERPSDFDGVVYISLDNGNWKTELGNELQAAGYDVDWNKVMKG